eukprot:scaffold145605_cov36-Tisochrysis_lutea.AAC.3
MRRLAAQGVKEDLQLYPQATSCAMSRLSSASCISACLPPCGGGGAAGSMRSGVDTRATSPHAHKHCPESILRTCRPMEPIAAVVLYLAVRGHPFSSRQT